MVICVVDDPKLDSVLDSIANVACSATKGNGKVFVTTVDDVLDIMHKNVALPQSNFGFFVALVSF